MTVLTVSSSLSSLSLPFLPWVLITHTSCSTPLPIRYFVRRASTLHIAYTEQKEREERERREREKSEPTCYTRGRDDDDEAAKEVVTSMDVAAAAASIAP